MYFSQVIFEKKYKSQVILGKNIMNETQKNQKFSLLAGFIGEKKTEEKKTPPDVLGSEIKYQCFIFYGPYNQKKLKYA